MSTAPLNVFTQDQESEVKQDVQVEQQQDPDLSWWISYVDKGKKRPGSSIPDGSVHRAPFNNCDKLKLKRGVLYRRVEHNGELRDQLLLLKPKVGVVLKMVYDEI